MRRLLGELACLIVPLSFAFIPVVGMLWVSAPELPPPGVSIARIAAALAAVVILLYLLLRPRSAVVASNTVGLPLLVMGLYPAAHAATMTLGWNEFVFAWAYLGLSVIIAWIVWRLSSGASATLHDVLTTVAVVLIVFGAGLVYRVYLRPAPYAAAVQQAMDALSSPLRLPERNPAWKPDVYDLVLDGMGRPDVLERDYAFSPRTEIEALRQLGFDIASNGHANYVQTQLSLASMLNLDYLDELAKAEGTGRQHGPLRDLISKSRVPALFKRLGYRIEFLGSGYLSSGAFELADVCDCPQLWFADAEVGALSLSPLKVLSGGVGSRAHYDRSMALFDLFERTRTDPAPRYVFAHVPMPHPPFVADAHGSFNHSTKPLSGGDGSFFGGSPDEYLAGYRAQATFTLSRAVRAVSRILEDGARAGRDSIVIVHGDHGPRLGFDALNPQAESGQHALPILLAVRWPAGHAPSHPPQSLVNVYRQLFQHVFQLDTPPLADRGYVSGFDKPYAMIPVRISSDATP